MRLPLKAKKPVTAGPPKIVVSRPAPRPAAGHLERLAIDLAREWSDDNASIL